MRDFVQNKKVEIYLWIAATIVAVPLAFIFEFVEFRRGALQTGYNDELLVPMLTILGLAFICYHGLRHLRRVLLDRDLGEK